MNRKRKKRGEVAGKTVRGTQRKTFLCVTVTDGEGGEERGSLCVCERESTTYLRFIACQDAALFSILVGEECSKLGSNQLSFSRKAAQLKSLSWF